MSPSHTTSDAPLQRVTSVTSTPTPIWPTMSTLVSLTCHHLPPVTCHHPSVTNMHLSHRPHTTWASPLWLFILHLCCTLWVSAFLFILPIHHLFNMLSPPWPLIILHYPSHHPSHHLILELHQHCSSFTSPHSCLSWYGADCIRHVKRSLICSIFWTVLLPRPCLVHNSCVELIVPCSVSSYFLPSLLGTNYDRCWKTNNILLLCTASHSVFEPMVFHLDVSASSLSLWTASKIADCSYPGKNSSIRTLPPLCSFCSAMTSGRSYQPSPWLTQGNLFLLCL